MVIGAVSIAVEAGIAEIRATAPEVHHSHYHLSPDAFHLHDAREYLSLSADDPFSEELTAPCGLCQCNLVLRRACKGVDSGPSPEWQRLVGPCPTLPD